MKKSTSWLLVPAALMLALAITPVTATAAASAPLDPAAVLKTQFQPAFDRIGALTALKADKGKPATLTMELDTLVAKVLDLRAQHAELKKALASGDEAAIARVGGAFHTTFEGLIEGLTKQEMPRDVIELVAASVTAGE